jgi:hypothetical protein
MLCRPSEAGGIVIGVVASHLAVIGTFPAPASTAPSNENWALPLHAAPPLKV